ncbi:MAG: PAS domain S-box protein [Ilumatobacteraceae bacterium]
MIDDDGAATAHLWRAVFEDAPIAVCVVTPEGRVVAANARHAELLGYRLDEADTLTVDDLTSPDDRPWTRSYLSRIISGEIDEYTTDKVFVRRDGTRVRARLSATAVRRDGVCIAILGFLSPVTDHRPLGDSWFRKVIENINDTITLIDADGTVLETSGRYHRVMGYPNEFWEGRSIFDVMLPEEAERVLEMREEILANPGQIVHTTVRMRSAAGGVEVLDVHASNLLADPEIGGILLTTRNITAEHALVEQLSLRRDEAVAEAELRSRMVATVSHELRNPLHGLQGISELLVASDLPAEARDMAATLHRQLLDLSRVVDDLLTTTRLELGSMVLELEPVDLRALCDDVVVIAAASVAPGVMVGVEVGPEVPDEVVTDPVRLRQVLANLVGNAVKFTEAGAVTLSVALPTPGHLAIRVSDTGIGIPPDELDEVFEPFRSATTAGSAAGAGLGLSIVKHIVDLLGGTVEVASLHGSGSTFVVTLPLATAAEHPPTVSSPAGPVDVGIAAGLAVLVIEDDAVNQQLARAQLRAIGIECHIVGTGEAGIEYLASPDGAHIDVVLMDYHLPGIDGVEAARRIRAAEAGTGRRVAIVGVTASASLGDRASCLAAGMDDHLPKPVSLADLRASIAKVADPRVADPRVADPKAARPTATAVVAAVPPTAGGDSGLAVVDVAVLEVLVDELADRSIVAGVVRTFLGQLDLRVDHIIDAVTNHDAAAARHWAHTLSSSARMVGASQLAEMGRAVERGQATPEAFRELAARVRDSLAAWGAAGQR